MKTRLIVMLALVVSLMVLGGAGGASAQGTTTHVVQPGETLGSIARQYGVTVEAIAFANGIINPNLIFAGEVLTIPITAPATPTPPGGTAVPGSTTPYAVVSGDTLFGIARRFGTTITTLVTLNNLANPDRLDVGQVLKIPAQSQPPTSTAIPANPTATSTPSTTITYVVQPGDTLTRIALKFNTTYQEIALLNGLDNPNLIAAGQTLIIRQTTTTPAPPTHTAVPTATATLTGTTPPTVVTIPAVTLSPTLAPSATATPRFPTPTPIVESTLPPGFQTPTPLVSTTEVPADAPNRLQSADFEAATHMASFADVVVVNGWEPFYCDQPYTADRCPALRQGTGNPTGLMMSRPSFSKVSAGFRVHGGTGAQSWSCPWAACRAGVYQTIVLTPGAVCEAGAYMQAWSTNDALGFTSQLAGIDDRANSTWSIRVDVNGGQQAFADGLTSSRGFGYGDGIYDHYALMTTTFTAASAHATIFFEDLRLWPFTNNASYIDDAYVKCTK